MEGPFRTETVPPQASPAATTLAPLTVTNAPTCSSPLTVPASGFAFTYLAGYLSERIDRKNTYFIGFGAR